MALTQSVLNQQQLSAIDPSWVLLDTCSTVSMYCNADLVHHITPCPENQELNIVTNGGSETFPYIATSKLLPVPVHFNPHSLANILSPSDVANIPGARLTMDTEIERAIVLHINDETITFHECKDGLHYYDTSTNKHSSTSFTGYSEQSLQFLQSVQENKQHYSQRQIAGADTARHIQAAIGFPGTTAFTNIIRNNLVRNSTITPDGIFRADRIYGPAPPLLQGKSIKSKPH